MPSINGIELAALALGRLPALKVLIITGYPHEVGLSDWPPHVALLVKPFRRTALIERLRSLFAAGQTIPPASCD